MNISKITQYAAKMRQQAAEKFGGKPSDYAWRGRTETGEAVGAFDIAFDMAKQHTSEDDAIISATEKLITDLSNGYSIANYYTNLDRLIEENEKTFKKTAAWVKEIINSAISDMGYHIVAEILKGAAAQIRDRFREIIRITYDEEVNYEFYQVTGEESEMSGESKTAADWLLSLMMDKTATPIYSSFVQLKGIVK